MVPSYLFITTILVILLAVVFIYVVAKLENGNTISGYNRHERSRNFQLLYYFFLLLLFSVVVTTVSYAFFSAVADKSKTEFDKWEKAIQVAISVAGFMSILITIKVWQNTSQQQLSQTTLTLFEKFRDNEIRDVRYKAWEVRHKWYNQDGYKGDFIQSTFVPINSKEVLTKNKYEADAEAVRQLFDFLIVLIAFNDSKEMYDICQMFDYGWWRPFLYDMAKTHDKFYAPVQTSIEQYADEFDWENYKKTISYNDKLKRLDAIFGFSRLPENLEFHNY